MGNGLSVRYRKKRTLRFSSLGSFVAFAVAALLLTRIQTMPSFDTNCYESSYSSAISPSENKHAHKDETGAFSDVMPADWRQWLAKHSNETNTEITIDKVEPTSLHTDWGCGISIKLLFQTRTEVEPVPSTTKAFFKAAYADMFHYDAESHLREVKAFYLDRILKTNVVLPCIGYHLDPQQILVEDENTWATIRENLMCVNEKPSQHDASSDHGTATVEGSIMLWMYDLQTVDKEKIVEKSRLFNSSKNDIVRPLKDREELESAMNYAIFHYLGACMKSEHNHFSYKKKKRRNDSSLDGNFGRQYVAIDNDRCMTPKAIFSNREVVPDLHFNRIQLWEELVFERICQISHHRFPVLQVVREAADSATKSGFISSHLMKALENDALSSELALSQPEAFFEIDERINKLGEYIRQTCPQ